MAGRVLLLQERGPLLPQPVLHSRLDPSVRSVTRFSFIMPVGRRSEMWSRSTFCLKLRLLCNLVAQLKILMYYPEVFGPVICMVV